MAVTKTIIKLSNTEAVIRISGVAGDTATIILDSDLLLPLEYLNNDPIQVNIGAVYCSGIAGGYASLIRNNVTILNIANKSLNSVDLLGEPFVPDSINNTSNIVVTITGQQSQVYIYLKKVSGFTSTDSVIDSAFNVMSLFGAGEQGAWYDPSDFQPNWRRNLLTYSQAIGGTNWTIFGNVGGVCNQNDSIAPDGTLTASKFITPSGSAVSTYIGQNITTVAGNFTGSMYIKYAGYQYVQVFCRTILDYVNIDLLSGSVTASSIGTPDITSVGNGWYRVALTSTLGAALNNNSISPIQTGTSGRATTFISDGTSGIYIWGAQLEQSSSASIYQKITDGIQDYYTVQPQPVLYQDSAGVTPVTAVEQPVGLMLDKSKGLAPGAELVTNGDFSNGTTGWPVYGSSTLSVVGGRLQVVASAAYAGTQQTLSVGGANKSVWFNFDAEAGGAQVIVQVYDSTLGTLLFNDSVGVGASVTKSVLFNTQSFSSITILVRSIGASTFFLDNISVKQIAGNHAFQATAGNRPVLSARVNLLTKTEDFSDAVWVRNTSSTVSLNSAIAPDGTSTATKLIESTSTDAHYIYQLGGTINTAVTSSIYMKKSTRNYGVLSTWDGTVYNGIVIDLTTGLVTATIGSILPPSIILITDGWYKITFARSINTTSIFWVGISDVAIPTLYSVGRPTYTGDGTSGIYIWHPDLRPTNAGALLPPYQRVNTASDYDTVGFPLYLKANGSSSAMSTNSIDFTSTDKMTVVTGVRKLSDAATAGLNLLMELSSAVGPNQGSFFIAAPRTNAIANYSYNPEGTVVVEVITPSNYAAPISNVLTTQSSIATPLATIRVNSTQVAISSSTQGTGNFGNYPLYLFSRLGTTFFLNGQFYGAIIRGAATDQTSVIKAEKLMATKTGITF